MLVRQARQQSYIANLQIVIMELIPNRQINHVATKDLFWELQPTPTIIIPNMNNSHKTLKSATWFLI